MKRLVKAYVDHKETARNIARGLIDRNLAVKVQIGEVEVYTLEPKKHSIVERLTNLVIATVNEASVEDVIEVFEGQGVVRGIDLVVDKEVE